MRIIMSSVRDALQQQKKMIKIDNFFDVIQHRVLPDAGAQGNVVKSYLLCTLMFTFIPDVTLPFACCISSAFHTLAASSLSISLYIIAPSALIHTCESLLLPHRLQSHKLARLQSDEKHDCS